MVERWEFVLVRIRDDYNTVVTVPKSEFPTVEQARARVESEFGIDKWRIGLAPDSKEDKHPPPAPDRPLPPEDVFGR